LVDELLDQHGQVHVLVNNAAVVTLGNYGDQTFDDMDWIVGITLWGVLCGCKLLLPHLKQADEAHIVNVSSSAGIPAPPSRSACALTKFAVRGFSECLRLDLARYNIGVACVYPPIVRTNISVTTCSAGSSVPSKATNPLSDRVAADILRGMQSDQARVPVGSGMRLLDLGKRLMPIAFDRILARYLEG
jgi:NAD(P)-dependent dehydrogenase (short-subunit alcohol dehydrogenase family)